MRLAHRWSRRRNIPLLEHRPLRLLRELRKLGLGNHLDCFRCPVLLGFRMRRVNARSFCRFSWHRLNGRVPLVAGFVFRLAAHGSPVFFLLGVYGLSDFALPVRLPLARDEVEVLPASFAAGEGDVSSVSTDSTSSSGSNSASFPLVET